MFNFFKKNIHEDSISKIESQIMNLPSFKYFLKNNSNLLILYKEYEITLIASAIYKNLFIQKNGSLNFKETSGKIKDIYFKKTKSFLRDQILSKNLFLGLLETYSDPNENQIILHVYVKFNKYYESIKESFIDGLPFWTEDLENQDYDEELGFSVTGIKHYHPFILNTLLSEIRENSENQKYIHTLDVWEIEDESYNMLQSFVSELKSIHVFH